MYDSPLPLMQYAVMFGDIFVIKSVNMFLGDSTNMIQLTNWIFEAASDSDHGGLCDQAMML